MSKQPTRPTQPNKPSTPRPAPSRPSRIDEGEQKGIGRPPSRPTPPKK
ncbi:hypothetical protein MHL31_08530 [Lutibacter sp. A80]|nr:hypothetical protein [Lutibacter sp. A80]UMB59128.1 hypothetical protein MHL31_08530 [Lutibacter sp. A80]